MLVAFARYSRDQAFTVLRGNAAFIVAMTATTAVGTKMDAANVRRDFRRALRRSPGSTRKSGHPASYGTRSSQCCPMLVCR